MNAWAIVLHVGDLSALGRLRRERGIEGCTVDHQIWLRGNAADDSLALKLRQLPARARYQVLADRSLVAEGTQVPRGYLPEATWQRLDEVVELAGPILGDASGLLAIDFSPESSKPFLSGTPVVLVRDDEVRQPNLLLTSFDAWSEYAVRAPALRLSRWSFAADDRGQALVRGTPLPPIAGRQFVEAEGLAVEAGWTWSPLVDAAVLRQKLSAAPADLVVLLHASSELQVPGGLVHSEVVPGSSFVRATRSAARLTMQGAAS